MNGATAEPWLNTINAPNNAKTIKIGISQNFFRVKINKIISFRKLILKLIFHGTVIITSFFPISALIFIYFNIYKIFLQQFKNQSYWKKSYQVY